MGEGGGGTFGHCREQAVPAHPSTHAQVPSPDVPSWQDPAKARDWSSKQKANSEIPPCVIAVPTTWWYKGNTTTKQKGVDERPQAPQNTFCYRNRKYRRVNEDAPWPEHETGKAGH